ncbi:tyrosine protein phosphatase [Bacillus lacus]|uniref:Tyrosine-protein phosphatase n=1 Tax=Metabacillus lacus TaxID=1983721 RepID=A0A7X2J057_9BACI|nr:CpsB/CapC family capsule biosynthesis tyrosine phosphatase [Metabacillus lacus]MRX73007.1 tyrosine protein phosphatase [Metabacillus lacus]
MIDIHSHILPKLDDGAQTMEDSLTMAKAAVAEGISSIIATPHHQNGRYNNNRRNILESTDTLNKTLLQENIPLKVLPGMETRIYGEIVEDLENSQILSLNHSNYLFIELPSDSVPRYTEKVLYDIQLRGYTPIIVHPERNAGITENPDKLYNLVKKGALTQITASSVCGYFGKNIKKFSHQLIEANLTHFIASDAHNISNRTFKLTEAMDIIHKEYGNDLVYLLTENAALLAENKTVYKEMPQHIKKKKFLGIF